MIILLLLHTQLYLPRLCGIDLNKSGKEYVAEPIGLFPSILYFIFVLFYQLIYYNDHRILLEYNAGLLSIIFMTFLVYNKRMNTQTTI
ncbi:hypothetical protein PFTANZ_00661 [Plasmodium falciparum Tanzania (2000708)]|uniref:Uncharacterized protein n=1 Tax=Plasmodium falciparum Tanzania (2000708) TaxID=1036725 RepID=A0A024WCG9_PLAFA|nr:hypothetical protein PFTANZ_00661 [Plasmodium falciparum Tanzania (2000708)]